MLVVPALMLLVAAVARAQMGLRPYLVTATAMFFSSDLNNDGVLQREEIEFSVYDTDGDGRITRYEYTSFIDTHSPQMHAYSHGLYDIYDVDSDHHLDAHDFDNFYNLMDGNGDGIVTRDEYVRYWSILLETLEHLHTPNGL